MSVAQLGAKLLPRASHKLVTVKRQASIRALFVDTQLTTCQTDIHWKVERLKLVDLNSRAEHSVFLRLRG